MKWDDLRRKLVVIVLGLGALSGCNNYEHRAKERERFGIELFNKGIYSKAELEFKSALKEDETLAKTHYYLALINEKNKKYVSMRENLIQAVKLAPDNNDARIKLGRVYLLFNEADSALNEANQILNASKDNLEGLTIKAASFIKQNKQGDALTIIDDILQKNPEYIEAISLKALILMQNQEFDDALTLLNPAIVSGVDDIALHLLKIQLDAKKNNIDDVIGDYERLVDLYPEKREFKYALAKIYTQASRIQDAENLIRHEINLSPLRVRPKLVLLDLLYSVNKEKAIEQVNIYSTEYHDKPEILLKIGHWLLSKKYLISAENLLSTIEIKDSNNSLTQDSKLLLAKIAFHNNQLEKSNVLISEILEINSENKPAKMLLAKIYIARETYTEAVELLNRLVWSDSDSDESLVLLAQIELEKGNPEKADKKFREALEVNPINMKALTSVTNRALRTNNVEYAYDLLSKTLKLQPDNIELLKIGVEIKMVSRDWNGATQILETLEKQPGGNLLAKFLRGRIHHEKGEYIQALSVFKNILKISPDYPDVLRQMAICYEMMKKRSEMIRFVRSFIKQYPENVTAHLIMGELYLLNKSYEKAISIYNRALAINNKIPQIYGALARIYTQQSSYPEAIKIYNKGLEENPKNVRLSIYLASVYEKINEYDKAIELYKTLLEEDPGLEIAKNNYASLLVNYFGDKTSLEKARQLVVKFKNSENPYYLDSFAWIELKLGNLKDAVPVLEKVNIMSDEAVFKFHLGVAYQQNGNEAGAVAYLKQAVELGKKQGGFDEIKVAQQLLDKLLIAEK